MTTEGTTHLVVARVVAEASGALIPLAIDADMAYLVAFMARMWIARMKRE